MANISTYLAAILSAVYGEDVRGSIHDAIEIINDVSEVVLSTGTAVTSATSSSTGYYNDSLYLNTNTFELWKCVGTNSWASQGTLKGTDGRSIVSISKTGTAGLVDTYTITYDSGSPDTFTVTNGADGANGADGSVWYKGTALTGTGTGITGCPGKQNDFYLNSSMGIVYTCTATGTISTATWDYVMTLTGGGGSSVTVIDNLSSTSSTDALSANQGRALNEKKQEKFASYSAGLKEEMVGPAGSQTLQLSLDMLAGSNISLDVKPSGAIEISASGSSGGASSLDDLSDVSIDTQTLDDGQILAYNQANGEFQNVDMPTGGHTMLPDPTSSPAPDEDDVVSAVEAALLEGGSNDDVPSLYGVGVWSNTDTITLMTTVSQGDTEMGTWEADDTWETSGVRTGWLQHAALHGILSAADKNDYEISLVFDVAGGEAISCLAYRIDDAITSSLGGIAIKFNAPIESVTASVGVVIKHNRTKTFTVPRT